MVCRSAGLDSRLGSRARARIDAEEEGEPGFGDASLWKRGRGRAEGRCEAVLNEQKSANPEGGGAGVAFLPPRRGSLPLLPGLPGAALRILPVGRSGRWRRRYCRYGRRFGGGVARRLPLRFGRLRRQRSQHSIQVLRNGAGFDPERGLASRAGDPELQLLVGHKS